MRSFTRRYLGGSNSGQGGGIAVDASGNAYVTGQTTAADFPVVNAFQSSFAGCSAAFVAKIDAAGSALIYSTYLGGSYGPGDQGISIVVDSSDDAYVTGSTSDTNFPGTSSSTIQPVYGGGSISGFVTKINASGSAIVYSTYLGGNGASGAASGGDGGTAIAVDSSGSAYVSGETESTNFPVVNAIQSTIVGQYDAFVAKINAAGSALVYSTYLGGSNNPYEAGRGIAVDASGNAYVSGTTSNPNFPGASSSTIQPTYGGDHDVFVAKINATGSAFVYSTYLGGSSDDGCYGGCGMAVDPFRECLRDRRHEFDRLPRCQCYPANVRRRPIRCLCG